jgi:hypothetical protein
MLSAGEIQKTEAIYGQNLAKMLTHFQTPLKKSAPDAEIRAVCRGTLKHILAHPSTF